MGYPDFLGSYSNYTDPVVIEQAGDASAEMEPEGGVGICQMYTRVLECCGGWKWAIPVPAQLFGYVKAAGGFIFFCLLV